jgi:hypothetical protein
VTASTPGFWGFVGVFGRLELGPWWWFGLLRLGIQGRGWG